jgi:hypothetical protein
VATYRPSFNLLDIPLNHRVAKHRDLGEEKSEERHMSMSTRFTREQFEQRIDTLCIFARQQRYRITALGPGRLGRHHYLVQNGENIVEVSLTSQGTFWLSTEQGMGSQGRISPSLMAWLEQEGLRHEYDHPFSARACEYLSGTVPEYAKHAPRGASQGMQENPPKSADGSNSRNRQVLPAQPGWFAVFARMSAAGDQDAAYEMYPIVGWVLPIDELCDGVQDDPVGEIAVVALCIRSTIEMGSLPDTSLHIVSHERTGFLGYAYPSCTIDWREVAASYRKASFDRAGP